METVLVVDSSFVLAQLLIGLGLVIIGISIGHWIGTIPQRAAAAEKRAEMARLRAVWVDGKKDLGFEDTSDYG